MPHCEIQNVGIDEPTFCYSSKLDSKNRCTQVAKGSTSFCANLLHTTTQAQDQVERRLLLDVIVGKCTAVFQLLACEDQSLLVRWDAFFILNLCLDIIDRMRSLHVKRDGFACQSLHKDLHATTQAQDQVERRLLLDVIVGKCTAVFQLLACEDQSLLIRWDAFF